MQPIDEALVFEAIRYQAAYRAEARQNHHRSIPGPLVAELLRYIEGSMEGITQSELELLLLSSRTARTTRLDGDNLGAQWRAYVAHRGRDVHEKREWRIWYGKYGKKEAIRQLAVADLCAVACVRRATLKIGLGRFSSRYRLSPESPGLRAKHGMPR